MAFDSFIAIPDEIASACYKLSIDFGVHCSIEWRHTIWGGGYVHATWKNLVLWYYQNSSYNYNLQNSNTNMWLYVHIMDTKSKDPKQAWWTPTASKTVTVGKYGQTSNISRTKLSNLSASRLVLQSFLPNPMKPGVNSTINNFIAYGATYIRGLTILLFRMPRRFELLQPSLGNSGYQFITGSILASFGKAYG